MNSWLAALSAVAGPATIAVIHLRQSRRDVGVALGGVKKVEVQRVQAFKELPRHWLHALSGVMLLALPFAQWIAYTSYRTSAAFLLPLAVLVTTFLTAGIFRPRVAFLQPPKHREWAFNGGMLTLALSAAFIMPDSGAALILRGALIDVLSLLIAAYGVRLYQGPATV